MRGIGGNCNPPSGRGVKTRGRGAKSWGQRVRTGHVTGPMNRAETGPTNRARDKRGTGKRPDMSQGHGPGMSLSRGSGMKSVKGLHMGSPARATCRPDWGLAFRPAQRLDPRPALGFGRHAQRCGGGRIGTGRALPRFLFRRSARQVTIGAALADGRGRVAEQLAKSATCTDPAAAP